MFYSQFILAKKGPLGTIWIAAHLERKLRKNQVTETNISVSVDSILFPEVPIALRLSGHLLLGVVRIYSRKVNYLFHDCSEALSMIKQAFNSGAVDLPPDAATAPFHSITIPENFDLDELEPLPERESNALFSISTMDQHVTSREQITLQEPLADEAYLAAFELDERFPEADADRMDMDFDEEPPEKTYKQDLSPVARLEEDEVPPMAEDEGIDFDRLEPDDSTTPAAVLDRVDEDDDFGHTLAVDEVEPMLDEERLEPSMFPLDDEMDFEQHVSQPSPVNAQDGAGLSTDDTGEVPASLNQCPDTSDEAQQNAAADTSTENVYQQTNDGLEVTETDAEKAQDEEADQEKVQEPGPQETVSPSLENGLEAVHPVTEGPPLEGSEYPSQEKVADSVEEQLHEEQSGTLTLPQDDAGTGEHVQGQDLGLGETTQPIDMNVSAGTPDNEGGQPIIEDVPEYEVVRSAVDAIEQEPDMLEMDKEPLVDNLDIPAPTADIEDQIMEDVVPPLVENDEVMHDALVRDEVHSPHFNSPVHEHDMPDSNDVLAEILGGRSTPAFGVVPTPLAVAAPRPVKPRVSKKRKAVFDLFDLRTVIHADAMRDQLANTADIRRLRKKAPCTRREFWLFTKDLQSNNSFREPSVPGLCPELREVFHRVCVYGEANLPKPGPQVLLLQNEKTPELEIGTEDVEEEQMAVDQGLRMEDGSGMALPIPSPDQNATYPNDDGENEQHQESVLEQHIHVEKSGLEGETQNVPSPEQPLANGDTSGAEVEAAGDEVDDDEAARQAAREAVLLEWEAFDNATLEHESLKEVDSQLAPQFETEVPPTELEEAVHVQQPGEMDLCSARSKEEEDGPLLAETSENDGGQDVPATELVETPKIDVEVETGEVDLTVPSEEGVPPGNDVEEATVPSESQDMDKIATELTVHDEGLNMDTPAAQLTHPENVPLAVPFEDTNLDTPSPEPFLDVENGDVLGHDGEEDEALPDTPGEDCEVEDLGFLGDARETVIVAGDEEDQHDENQYLDTVDYGDSETLPQDNTGWSVRTRAVGRYLRVTLEGMEMNMKRVEGHTAGPARLGLERTLAGKSRKEAARMFFETLVLKTKDYIHVEQEEAYSDIKLSARPRLLKAAF